MNDLVAEDFTPDPLNLLESNRNLGYSIEEAVSDLIDNSIAAKAKNISFHLTWNNGNPFFALLDDGIGMSNKDGDLVRSFRLGSQNPLEERDPSDLGRFGFGMKTASLSQSRSFIVASKKTESELISRSLDLDFISSLGNGWKLKKVNDTLLCGYEKSIIEKGHGTVIIWDNWDRAPKKYEDFANLGSDISNYLSVCFHRFIESGVNIFADEILLPSFSPIPNGDGAEERSKIHLSDNSDATQTAYVLQHPSNWAEEYESSLAFNSFRLFNGFERQQGIYIYRCNRLLTPRGGWLGVLKRGNSAKLARVVIDYPNNADSLWSLDITKTNAKIPYEFKNEIESFVKKTRVHSVSKINSGNRKINEAISYKGGLIWEEYKDKGAKAATFRLNSNHSFFKNLIENKIINKSELKDLLQLISEHLPFHKIISNNDEDPSQHDKISPREKLNELEVLVAKNTLVSEMSKSTKDQAITKILSMEPFCYHEDFIRNLADE